MVYEDIFTKLNKRKVNYLVVGGIALVLHGVVRLTADLDLIVKLQSDNLAKFISVMKELGYKPRVPVKAEEFIDPAKREIWIKEKGMRVFSFYHPKKTVALVDVFVDEPIEYRKLEAEQKWIKAGGIKIPVISVKHLIELKEISGRAQDIADIKALREVIKFEKESRK
jgi:predicted nucleotidyltransferase